MQGYEEVGHPEDYKLSVSYAPRTLAQQRRDQDTEITFAGGDVPPGCDFCGAHMQRTGACFTCPSCGESSGCG